MNLLILSALQDGSKPFVKQHGDNANSNSFQQIKWEGIEQHNIQFCFDEWNKLAKRSNQLVERHKRFKYGKKNKVVDDGSYNSHHDAGGQAGNQRRFLRLVEFINKPGNRNKTASHDKIGKLPDTAGGGSEQLQGVFYKFNQYSAAGP